MCSSNSASTSRVRGAFVNPLGLTLVVFSLLLAAGVRWAPGLERWSAQALWLVGWGLLAYAASVLAVRRWQPEPTVPELREVESVRRFMAETLAERRGSGRGASEFTRILADAVDHLDREVVPALRQLLARQSELGGLLDRYETGRLPRPAPAVLNRLQSVHAGRRGAIDECVQQASSAAGTLVALLQAGDESDTAEQARGWAAGLLRLHDAIVAALDLEREGRG